MQGLFKLSPPRAIYVVGLVALLCASPLLFRPEATESKSGQAAREDAVPQVAVRTAVTVARAPDSSADESSSASRHSSHCDSADVGSACNADGSLHEDAARQDQCAAAGGCSSSSSQTVLTTPSTPHGPSGVLVDLMAPPTRREEFLKVLAPQLVSLTLTPRQACDIELLLNGGFSPLETFMSQSTYESVLNRSRLDDSPTHGGVVWPMPITLDVSVPFAESLNVGQQLALRDQFYNLVAILTVHEKYRPDKVAEAERVFGTTDSSHPAVSYLMNIAGEVYLSGPLEGVSLPYHHDFPVLRRTPAQVRAAIAEAGWERVVAFQTRNPMHLAHIELNRRAAKEVGGGVLIHPVVGMTKPGDIPYPVRVRCYQAVVDSGDYFEPNSVLLSLLPLAMRMAGPREAVWHALIRKNYGATHFIIGRDHAGCSSESGESFYEPYAAQQFAASFGPELGISLVKFQQVGYVVSAGQYLTHEETKERYPKDWMHQITLSISGTQFRRMLSAGAVIPSWFSDPRVVKILQDNSPPLSQRGFTVFFTGLSGSGKTTLATALADVLSSRFIGRHISLLDGDVVRTHLSAGLGFTTKDRNINVARIGWVAAEIVKHRGIAIASVIAPFKVSRDEARALVTDAGGGFFLIHVNTPVAVCAQRDVKGLYAKAKAGLIKLTGISHPYEEPSNAALVIDTSVETVSDSIDRIVQLLDEAGYFPPGSDVEHRDTKLDNLK